MAPLVVLAGPRGMSSSLACLSSIALATCSLTLCRLSTFENADASIIVSSFVSDPSLVVSASKSDCACVSWNFSERSYTSFSDWKNSVPVVSLTMLKNSARIRSSDSCSTWW